MVESECSFDFYRSLFFRSLSQKENGFSFYLVSAIDILLTSSLLASFCFIIFQYRGSFVVRGISLAWNVYFLSSFCFSQISLSISSNFYSLMVFFSLILFKKSNNTGTVMLYLPLPSLGTSSSLWSRRSFNKPYSRCTFPSFSSSSYLGSLPLIPTPFCASPYSA